MLTTLLIPCAIMLALPEGPARIEVATSVGRLDVFTYKPPEYRDGPLIVVCHGVLRNAEEYRDHAIGMARRFGAIVAAPRFPESEFPIEQYQLGGLLRQGEVQPLATCSWNAVPNLVAEIRRRENRPQLPFYLIGHSGGGQFLIRLSGFLQTEAVRIVVSNPGTYLLPTRDESYPYGFGGLPSELSDDAWLKRYLAQPVTLYLGMDDVKRDEHLNVTPPAERLGRHRYERGQNAFRMAEELARKHGWPFGWKIVRVPQVGHDHAAMFDHELCRLALFGETR
ncbi:MAG: hypothetical protein JNM18_19885 [Planctomycetaceae bacterium]|nr:hypothetical protein [Planctomycetaceae bacterium]